MKVALVHDYLTQRGGAERVALSLCRMFPDAPLFTSVYDPEQTFPEFADVDVRTSFLQRLPHGNPRALLPLYPRAFGRLLLSGYDLVISSTSGWSHGVLVEDGLHIAYCHTPPRWLYRTDTYLDVAIVPRPLRPLLAPLLKRLRRWDQIAASCPDIYVANSHAVARRVADVYGRSAPVIYPPVHTTPCTTEPVASEWPYYLVVSRLLPYKRVDLAIEACNRLGRRLVVVGSGPMEEELKQRAGHLVEFRADVDDEELACLMASCTALLQAGEEDFGIVPLEANAAGRPVVAFAAGGALDTVESEVSGVLFHRQTVDSLIDALHRVEARTWDRDSLRAHAAGFGERRFHAELSALIDLRVQERAVVPTSPVQEGPPTLPTEAST